MATSALSSLGIGSGVLTHDVIDQLKKADEEGVIKPYVTKMETNTKKQAELASLTSILSSMKSVAAKLSDYSTYMGRKTTVSGEQVSATAGSGFVTQDIKITVNQLAAQDVFQSQKGYASRDSSFSSYGSKLSFMYDGTTYNINIKANQTLQEVSQAITDATDGKVAGTIMKTGGTNPYKLTLTATDSGADNKIYFGSTIKANSTPSGEISLGAGDFNVSLKGSDGNMKTIAVELPTTSTSSSALENGEKLRDAVIAALKASGDFNDMIADPKDENTKDYPIHIEFDREKGGLIINDSRGNKVSVSGTKANTLGFTGNNTSDDRSNIIEGSAVKAGKINGKVTIGADTIDIGALTASGKSGAQNAQAIVDYINNNLGAKYTASVGKDGNLLINSATGGTSINMVIVGANGTQEQRDSTSAMAAIGLTAGTNRSQSYFLDDVMKLSNIQVAKDAEFTYNGVAISRSSNTFDDVASGLSITLNEVHESGKSSTIKVTDDVGSIADDVKSFVESYNELLTKLTEVTKYDQDLDVAGIFQGVSQVYGIRGALNSILTSTNNNGKSLLDFGIMMKEDGTLELDEEKLNKKINDDYKGTQEFFRGYTATVRGVDTEFDGVFKRFETAINGLIDGTNSTLKLYDTSLTNELKTLDKQRLKAQETIDKRYEIMAMRFAAYDSIINGINAQFSSLQQQITMAMNG